MNLTLPALSVSGLSGSLVMLPVVNPEKGEGCRTRLAIYSTYNLETLQELMLSSELEGSTEINKVVNQNKTIYFPLY